MARPIDPDKHTARRLHIIDVASTALAAEGYAGATTAVICRTARIGSGTFFHYSPTKNAVLLAILELGTGETRELVCRSRRARDARAVLLDWVEHCAGELEDPELLGSSELLVP